MPSMLRKSRRSATTLCWLTKIPSITLDLASGGVKVKATVTVTFDGMNNDTYKLVGTSGLSILG